MGFLISSVIVFLTMEASNIVTAAFILLILLMVAGYMYSNHDRQSEIAPQKIMADTDISEATESEPEVELKRKPVDKMAPIHEKPDTEERKADDSDSEEYSMAKMVEEYHKSRTFRKKVEEVLEDISDFFVAKRVEMKRKFGPE